MDEYTSVAAQVEYGLEEIDSDRKVEVSLRDLLYVYGTLGEMIRFFHQPNHYTNIEQISNFLGNSEASAFHLLRQCYYEKLRDVWPQDVIDKFDSGDFDHPNPPYYYQFSGEE